MDLPLNRDQLSRMERTVIQTGTYFKTEICIYEAEGVRWAVKDCSRMETFLKGFVGRRNQNREVAIYRRLRGLEGVPDLIGVIDQDAFAVEFIEGETLSRGLGPIRLKDILKNMEEVINSIHAKRVVHLDLKQKRNILVCPDNSVKVVDFQSAFSFGEGFLARLVFSFLKKRDRAGLIKFKAKYVPELLSPSEKRSYSLDRKLAKLWPFTHLVRFLRKFFNKEKTRLQ